MDDACATVRCVRFNSHDSDRPRYGTSGGNKLAEQRNGAGVRRTVLTGVGNHRCGAALPRIRCAPVRGAVRYKHNSCTD